MIKYRKTVLSIWWKKREDILNIKVFLKDIWTTSIKYSKLDWETLSVILLNFCNDTTASDLSIVEWINLKTINRIYRVFRNIVCLHQSLENENISSKSENEIRSIFSENIIFKTGFVWIPIKENDPLYFYKRWDIIYTINKPNNLDDLFWIWDFLEKYKIDTPMDDFIDFYYNRRKKFYWLKQQNYISIQESLFRFNFKWRVLDMAFLVKYYLWLFR